MQMHIILWYTKYLVHFWHSGGIRVNRALNLTCGHEPCILDGMCLFLHVLWTMKHITIGWVNMHWLYREMILWWCDAYFHDVFTKNHIGSMVKVRASVKQENASDPILPQNTLAALSKLEWWITLEVWSKLGHQSNRKAHQILYYPKTHWLHCQS